MFRFRFSHIGVAIMVMLASVLTMAPTVAAHAADTDGGGVCYGNVKIVVFDGGGQTGADDDFCFYTGYTNLVEDPNFSSNDPTSALIPEDDIGNRYLMNCCVSSVSIRNDSNKYLCVHWFPQTNFGGFAYSSDWYVTPNSHSHIELWTNNDTYKSLKVNVYTNQPSDC